MFEQVLQETGKVTHSLLHVGNKDAIGNEVTDYID